VAASFGVFFASDRLPTLAAWEQAASDLGVRLRLRPVDLTSHSGMLTAAFESDDDNTGFEFELRSDWGRDDAFADLHRDKDSFAWFRCFNREFPAAVWAAVSFAKASGGVFQDDRGSTLPTLEEALAFARGMPVHGPEFFFEGEPVGLFIGAEGPRTPGSHDFEPLAGPGYFKAMDLLQKGGTPRCEYRGSGERVSLIIQGRPYSDVLDLGDFEITRLADA
jgi:hypothetical protein